MEEKITIPNKQNLQLSTILHYPGKNIKYPAVIVLHGFSGSKDEEHIVKLASDLQRKGFCAMRFDMSGLGESEGTLETDYRLSNFMDDIDVVFNLLQEQFFIDPKCIGIVGHSMGGKAALLYAARNQAISSVCAISPPYQMGETGTYKNKIGDWKKTGWMEKTSEQFGILNFPYEFIEDAMRHDVRKVAREIKQPKLIVWGTKDTEVTPREMEELYDFLDPPKESFVVKGMAHDYKHDPKLIQKVNNRIISFFSEVI